MTDATTGLQSMLMHNLKKNTFAIFDDIPVPFETFLPGAERGSDDFCLSFLGYDKVKQRYKQYPKILYPVGEGDKASVRLFQSPAMIKVQKSLFHFLCTYFFTGSQFHPIWSNVPSGWKADQIN